MRIRRVAILLSSERRRDIASVTKHGIRPQRLFTDVLSHTKKDRQEIFLMMNVCDDVCDYLML